MSTLGFGASARHHCHFRLSKDLPTYQDEATPASSAAVTEQKNAKIPPFHGFEPIFLDQTSILRARSAARSATRRVAAPLENFGLPRVGYEHFSRGGAALRSSTGKTKVGLLLELSTMVP